MREQPWPWRDHLTDDERQTLDMADAAKAEWERLAASRPRIVNRAIQRAKYAARQAMAEAVPTTGGGVGSSRAATPSPDPA